MEYVLKGTLMRELDRLERIGSWKQEMTFIESSIKERAVNENTLYILEAGCGRKWGLDLEGIRYVLVGVDMDRAALETRKNVLKDLHEMIEGDLRYVELPDGKFDVIYSSFVLEHIEGAELVLKNFVKWLKPDGIIIIRIPDPNSVYGFVTRMTPHWFHVLFKRRILGLPNAGKPGHGPYPTYYDPVVSRSGIRDFCQRHRLEIKAEYGDGYFRSARGLTAFSITVFKRMVHLASFGFLSWRHTNLLYVLQGSDRVR